MKKVLLVLAVLLIQCTGWMVFAEENPFVGRWNEEGELGSSIILRSDGSCEGNLMLFYEMEGSYTLNHDGTATLHIEAVRLSAGMEMMLSGKSSLAAALQDQLDSAQLVLTNEDTLTFSNVTLHRDKDFRETVIINDGNLEGQWELKDHANKLDQLMLYFTPDGIVYAASDGKITEMPYTFDGTTVVMGETNVIRAVLQQDGSLKVDFAGIYVKTHAYSEPNFAAITGLYGENQDGYVDGYYITAEGQLLDVFLLPGIGMQWRVAKGNLVMAGNRIGEHDHLGNRFYAIIDDGELLIENWTIRGNRWERDDVEAYPLLLTSSAIEELLGLDSYSDDLPTNLAGMYMAAERESVLVIYPDGKAMMDNLEISVMTNGNQVALFSEGDSGYVYFMTYADGALTMSDGSEQMTFTRVSDIDAVGTDDEAYINLFDLTITPEGVTINGLSSIGSNVTELTIPAKLCGLPVIAVRAEAFRGEQQLVSVTIEEGVQTIGDNVFARCYALETVILPDSITSIGTGLFSNCTALRSVVWPAGVTKIPDRFFYSCPTLSSVLLPEGVTAIGESAFAFCTSLEEITLPSTLTEIGEYAFMSSGIRSLFIPEGVEYFHASMIYDAKNLEEVYFPRSIKRISNGTVGRNYSRNYYYSSSVTFYLLNSDYELSKNLVKKVYLESYDNRENDLFTYAVLEDNTLVITGWKGEGGNLVIPATIDGMPVSAIGEKAFLENKTIESVYIEEGVTRIGQYAFFGCSMETIYLPSTLRTLEISALAKCGVKSLYLPEGLETIENNALSINGASEIYIPASVQTIHAEAFGYFCIDATLYVYDKSVGYNHGLYRGMSVETLEAGEIMQAPDGTILKNSVPAAERDLEESPTPSPEPTATPAPTAEPAAAEPPQTAELIAQVKRSEYILFTEHEGYDPATDTLYLSANDTAYIALYNTQSNSWESGSSWSPYAAERQMVTKGQLAVYRFVDDSNVVEGYYVLAEIDGRKWAIMISGSIIGDKYQQTIDIHMRGFYPSPGDPLNWLTDANLLDAMNFVLESANVTKRYTLCADPEYYDAQTDLLSIQITDSVEMKIIDNATGESVALSDLPGASVVIIPYGKDNMDGLMYTAGQDNEMLLIYDHVIQDILYIDPLAPDCDHSDLVLLDTKELIRYTECVDDQKHQYAIITLAHKQCRLCTMEFWVYNEGLSFIENNHQLNQWSVCDDCGYMQDKSLCSHSKGYSYTMDMSIPRIYFDITEDTHRYQYSEKMLCDQCNAHLGHEVFETKALEHYFILDTPCECGYVKAAEPGT